VLATVLNRVSDRSGRGRRRHDRKEPYGVRAGVSDGEDPESRIDVDGTGVCACGNS